MTGLTPTRITIREWRRDWDTPIFSHAMPRFLKVKQNIPCIPALALLA